MGKYVASISFGKDSLAMPIKIKELGMPYTFKPNHTLAELEEKFKNSSNE